jgi:hypothetical protein
MAPRKQRDLAPIMALIPGSNYGGAEQAPGLERADATAGVLDRNYQSRHWITAGLSQLTCGQDADTVRLQASTA